MKTKGVSIIRFVPWIYLLIGAFVVVYIPPALRLDIFCYFSVAKKYSMGEFFYALNGYWAPLISWLLALFFKLGFFWKGLQVINLIAGFLLIFFTIRIAVLLKLSEIATWLLVILNSILSLVHQLDSSTPDFLSAVCLMVFAFYYYESIVNSSKYGWVKSSVAALILIFSKVFYFYFFIGLLMIHGVLLFWIERKKWNEQRVPMNLLKQLILVISVYFIWVLCLSLKYEKFVFSATGSYNSQLITPEGQAPQYYNYSGLVQPPDDYSFGNEDPTYAFIKARNPFESKQAWKYQLDVFRYNFRIMIYLFGYLSYFKWFILLLPLFLFLLKNTPERNVSLCFFIMGSLIIFGYFLIFYEDRYVLPALFCYIVSIFFLFDRLYFLENNKLKLLLLLIPFIAFGKNSIDTFRLWLQNKKDYADTMEIANKLVKSKLFEGKRIANSADAFGGTYLSMLSLESSSRYYGELGMYHNNEENFKDLEKYKIEYLFYFNCARISDSGACIDTKLPFYLENKKIVYSDPSARLTVYKLF